MKNIKEYFEITGKIWIMGFIILSVLYFITLGSINLALLSSTLVCLGLLIMNFLMYLYYKS